MKSFKSTVSAVFASLFLYFSISGCQDNDAQTAFQSGENGSPLVKSSDVKLVLKPGVIRIAIDFVGVDDADRKNRQTQVMGHMQKILENSGVLVRERFLSTNGGWGYFEFTPLTKEIVVRSLNKEGLGSIRLDSQMGVVANWDPFQGNSVEYKSAG